MNHETVQPAFQEKKPEEALIKSKELLGKWLKECPEAKKIINLFKKYANLQEANFFSVKGENRNFGISAPSKEKVKGKSLGYIFIKWDKDDKKNIPSPKCNFTLEMNEEHHKFPGDYEPMALVYCQLDNGDEEININDLSLIGVGRIAENNSGQIRSYINKFNKDSDKK